MRWKVAILATSDRGARGEREETSAQVIRELIEEEMKGEIVEYRLVPDEKPEIMAALIEITEYYNPDLIFTTGGIGLKRRDVTPEATLEVIHRPAPGFAEAIRAGCAQKDPRAMATRGVSGLRGQTLIINLPGHPKGVHESLAVIIDQLPFALTQLAGLETEEE